MKYIIPRTAGYILEAGEFEMNTENLLKLADYLETQAVQEEFDMGNFAATHEFVIHRKRTKLVKGDSKQYHECGTVCCAAGSGIKAGIPYGDAEDWYDYSRINFIDTDTYTPYVAPDNVYISREMYLLNDPWEWCFSGGWASIDNTPAGAAKRIRYLIEHGAAPDDAYDQLEGEAPYMFAGDQSDV